MPSVGRFGHVLAVERRGALDEGEMGGVARRNASCARDGGANAHERNESQRCSKETHGPPRTRIRRSRKGSGGPTDMRQD